LHAIASDSRARLVGALPNGSPALFNEGKGFNERPTAPKNAQLKADVLGPNLQRSPNGKGIRWATQSKLTHCDWWAVGPCTVSSPPLRIARVPCH